MTTEHKHTPSALEYSKQSRLRKIKSEAFHRSDRRSLLALAYDFSHYQHLSRMDPLPAGVSICHCSFLNYSPPLQDSTLHWLIYAYTGMVLLLATGFFMAYCIALQHYLRRQCISRPSPMHRCIKLVGLLDWTFSLAFVVLDGLALAPLVRILMFTFLAERAVGVQLVGCVHLSQFASAGSFILSSSLCPFAWHIL